MGGFDWGTGEEKKSDVMATPFGDVPATPGSGATQEAAKALESVRGKRGRRSREEVAEDERRRLEQFAQEYAKLFDPNVWKGICRSPADLMLVATKRDLWRIEDKELEPLSVGAANTARLFLKTDPKWVALTMFLISFAQIYGGRAAIHIAQARKEAREKGGQK